MNGDTMQFLQNRTWDYYRRTAIPQPPEADAREWAVVPWQQGSRSRMYRHKSLIQEGGLDALFKSEKPRHVYYSGATYEHPHVRDMEAKEHRYTDLLFDIDFDHLPEYEGGTDASMEEVLQATKAELRSLITILEDDFDFSDFLIKFSGNRGYHLHVYDDEARSLSSAARDEIIQYVVADSGATAALRPDETVTAPQALLPYTGGRPNRVYTQAKNIVQSLIDETASLDTVNNTLNTDFTKDEVPDTETLLTNGFQKLHTATFRSEANTPEHQLVHAAIETAETNAAAYVDEAVTNDMGRLIRAQGTIHGGRGLVVREIDRDNLRDFNPLADAVPELFTERSIDVEVTTPDSFTLNGKDFDVAQEGCSLPEYAAISLMCQGKAEL